MFRAVWTVKLSLRPFTAGFFVPWASYWDCSNLWSLPAAIGMATVTAIKFCRRRENVSQLGVLKYFVIDRRTWAMKYLLELARVVGLFLVGYYYKPGGVVIFGSHMCHFPSQ